MAVRVTEHAFDPGTEIAAFNTAHSDAGALATFIGYCRAVTAGKSSARSYRAISGLYAAGNPAPGR